MHAQEGQAEIERLREQIRVLEAALEQESVRAASALETARAETTAGAKVREILMREGRYWKIPASYGLSLESKRNTVSGVERDTGSRREE